MWRNRLLYASLLILPAFYFDQAVVIWVRDYLKPNFGAYTYWLDPGANHWVAYVSNGATLLVLSILLYLAGRVRNNKTFSDAGKFLVAGFAASGITVQIIKHLLGRARPRIAYETLFTGPSLRGGYDSFPSGHTAAAFSLAFIISLYLPKYRVCFYLFAVLIALSRVIGLSHFPSDILAGAVVGLAVGKVMLLKLPGLRASVQASGEK
ncbi:MAG: phosphatase PAP2 family protein [Candidatus Sulfobium sp.]